MKRLKHFKNSWLILGILFIVAACNNNGDDDFSVDADVVFIKKKINNEVVTGVAYYAYGNKSLDSVEVVLPNSGGTVSLEQYENFTYTFWLEPENGDFTSGLPVEGNYLFKITGKNGEYIEASDEQEFDNLNFAEIDSTNFDQSNNWFYVNWGEVDGADGYVVRLYKLSGEMIFNGLTTDDDTQEYHISDYWNTGTWAENPEKGQKYILRIQSIKYDQDATNDDYIYNIQEVSAADQEITWQLE